MSGLLPAENIAGAAKLEIERCKSKAGAEIREFADRPQPTTRDRRQLELAWNQTDTRKHGGSNGRHGHEIDKAAKVRSCPHG